MGRRPLVPILDRGIRTSTAVEELHRFVVDREDDTAGFADHAMTGSGGADRERAGGNGAILVPLGASQDKDVLKPGVSVKRDLARLPEAKERGGRTLDTVPIEAVNLHSFLEGFPRNLVGIFGDAKEVAQFDATVRGSFVGLQGSFFFHGGAGL